MRLLLFSLSLPFLCALSLARARSLLRSSHSSPHPTRDYRDFDANAGLEYRFQKLDEELKDTGGRMDAKFKELKQVLLRKTGKVRMLAGRGRACANVGVGAVIDMRQ
jgi:hypothetical protein